VSEAASSSQSVGYRQWFNSPHQPRHAAMDGRSLVAWNLRRLRVARGLSQERLALESGVDRAYVSGLERGRENPTVDVLDRLAAILVAPLAAFFAEPDDPTEPAPALKAGRKPK